MKIDFADLKPSEIYHVMTQTIVPRPIAWVLTDNGVDDENETAKKRGDDRISVDGSIHDPEQAYNLAPFSYFNAVSSDPALIMLSIGSKPSGGVKDTRRNLLERKNCVIHIACDAHAELVTASAQTLDHGQSEIQRLGLALVKQPSWLLPRLEIAPIAMACVLYDYQEIGPNKQGLLFCEIKEVYVDDACITQDDKGRDKIAADKIRPLARLGASEYASFGEIISHARPK